MKPLINFICVYFSSWWKKIYCITILISAIYGLSEIHLRALNLFFIKVGKLNNFFITSKFYTVCHIVHLNQFIKRFSTNKVIQSFCIGYYFVCSPVIFKRMIQFLHFLVSGFLFSFS